MRPVLSLVTAAAVDVLSLADVKSHLRIDHDDDDAMLTAYLAAATALVDGATGRLKRALNPQTWKQAQPRPNGYSEVWLELPPVISLTSIQYVDTSGNLQTATLSDFDLIEMHDASIVRPKLGKSWPAYDSGRPDALQITFQAGYALGDSDAVTVPAPILSAIRLLVGHFYVNREASTEWNLREIPIGVDALLEQYKSKWYA